MTFTEIIKDIFARKPKDAQDNSQKMGLKAFMSKLSGAFMLPISIMAIAGLFLGVGAAIESQTSADTFGLFVKNLGDPIFGAMPALFMIAIVIAFTEEAGVAVFAGLLGFLVFNAIQIPFIDVEGNGTIGTAKFLGIETSSDIQAKLYKTVGTNLGIVSLNTSIFGGVVVGFISAYLYNKFYQIQLPQFIAFFGGKRFVAIINIIMMIPLAFLFLLIWPWIGLGFAYFGQYSGQIAGFDSFIFGFVERALVPFGLHHAFYAPLWWTGAGGDIQAQFNAWEGVITQINGEDMLSQFNNDNFEVLKEQLLSIEGLTQANIDLLNQATPGSLSTAVRDILQTTDNKDVFNAILNIEGALNFKPAEDLNDVFINKITANGNYLGDSFGWLAVNGSGINSVTYKLSDGVEHSASIYPFIADQLGIRFGRFMQGKFAFMQLGLPAAALAMVMAAPKENRKEAFSICFPAALTSFLTGVTEPIEFTFLFLAPVLFWGFHATMAALSFLLMNILGAHVGMTFSGGFIDTIIYGMIPYAQGTNFYWIYVIGIAYAPIYFFVFYWWIKRFNLETPGRGKNKQLFTKKDFRSKNKKTQNSSGISSQGAAIVLALGGWDNITKYANCASRLRYNVKDKTKVDEAALKAARVNGIRWVGDNHIQIIVGTVSEQLNANIKANIGASLTSENNNKKSTNTIKLKTNSN